MPVYIALKTNIKHDFDGRIERHNKPVFANVNTHN